MVDSGGGGGEVELNLAPIIDCFTVLITYLLVTASFITLTAVDVGVNAVNNSSETPPPVTTPEKTPMSMTMDLMATGEILLKVSGGELKQEVEVKVPGVSGQFDADGLTASLTKIHEQWADVKEVSVNAAPTTKYKEVVTMINEAQKTITKVYLAGG